MFCFIHDGICTCSHFMIVLFAGELFYDQPRPKSQHYADVTQYTFVRFGKTTVESWELVWGHPCPTAPGPGSWRCVSRLVTLRTRYVRDRGAQSLQSLSYCCYATPSKLICIIRDIHLLVSMAAESTSGYSSVRGNLTLRKVPVTVSRKAPDYH